MVVWKGKEIVYTVGMDQDLAHIIAVSMGYGHLRAAYGLRHISGGHVICANDYLGIPEQDKKRWQNIRHWYERISRFKKVPLIGQAAFSAMDKFQEIEPFYPRRDLSAPTLQVNEIYRHLRSGWCKHLIASLATDPRPLVSTFMTAAFAAEVHNYPGDIYTVICDSDVSRGWVAQEPRKSRITYFAPTGRVVERLQCYGVPKEKIIFTGFPLPPENVGGIKATGAIEDLSRRLCVLDPQGVFSAWASPLLVATLGQEVCDAIPDRHRRVPHVAFAIGGAGAQKEMCFQYIKSLAPDINAHRLTFSVITGTHQTIKHECERVFREVRLEQAQHNGYATIVSAAHETEYFSAFAQTMRDVDILITKPSELSFYAGLGIPIIMTPPVGSQENYNRLWLYQTGAGVDGLDPRYAREWLWDWIRAGALARQAWNGYVNAPKHGAYRIEDVLRQRPWSVRQLPMIV